MSNGNITKKVNRKGTIYYVDDNNEVVSKVCAKCSEVKSLSDFQKHKAGLGGRESACKSCKSGYYEKNKDSFVHRYDSNKEHLRELSRTYYLENRDTLLDYSRNYYRNNKEYLDSRNRTYRKDNKERIVNLQRRWRRDNPNSARLITQRRLARKKSLIDDLTPEQMRNTFEYFGGCSLTGEVGNNHWDHVIPLSTGKGGTTYGNMIPLRADLNLSKSDDNIFDWFERNSSRFSLSRERFDRLIEWLAGANDMTTVEYKEYVFSCFSSSNEIGSHSA
jgi:hypothetical protein